MFLQNKYTKWYYNIISNAQSRNTIIGYSENHHIIPDCFFKDGRNKSGWLDGNPNESSNIIKLTAREHFICHLLLSKMVEGRYRHKMITAVVCMMPKNKNKSFLSSRLYQSLKEEYAKTMTGEGNPMFGKEMPIETRIKISKTTSGIPKPPRSTNHCINMSKAKKNIPWSESRRANSSRSKNLTIDGVEYPSIGMASKALGYSSHKVKRLANQEPI